VTFRQGRIASSWHTVRARITQIVVLSAGIIDYTNLVVPIKTAIGVTFNALKDTSTIGTDALDISFVLIAFGIAITMSVITQIKVSITAMIIGLTRNTNGPCNSRNVAWQTVTDKEGVVVEGNAFCIVTGRRGVGAARIYGVTIFGVRTLGQDCCY
jgi:precorrin isomerase